MRYEVKFTTPANDHHELTDWLVRQPGLQTAYPSRQVISLYFDSIDLVAAQENLAGISCRRKYRLRWYRDSRRQYYGMHYEIKQKQGGLGRKSIGPSKIQPEDLTGLSSPEIMERLKQDNAAVHWPTLSFMLPVLVVSYHRVYYQCPSGIRLTIDSGLQFHDSAIRFPDEDSGFAMARVSVIELKFTPDQKNEVAGFMKHFPWTAVRNSKYLLGLSHLQKAVYI